MAGTEAPRGGPGPAPHRHEKRDVNLRAVSWITAALLASIPIVLLAMDWTFDHFAEREARRQPAPASLLAAPAGEALPPQPRLQANPVEELRAARAEDRERLASYGWADRAAGKVRIPIDRAIDLLLERGLPVRAGAEGGADARGGEAR